MGTYCGGEPGYRQEQNVFILRNKGFCARDSAKRGGTMCPMPSKPKSTEADKKAWQERVVARIEDLLSDMGWDYEILADRTFEQFGYKTSKTIKQWFERRSIPAYALHQISEYVGISIAYLMLEHDTVGSAADPDGLYSQRSRIHHLEGELAEYRKRASSP